MSACSVRCTLIDQAAPQPAGLWIACLRHTQQVYAATRCWALSLTAMSSVTADATHTADP